jgi:3-oxoacyl-[acyl-carrier protein] reductase
MNIIITGVSRGIGLSLAKYYTESGNNVFGCSRSAPDYNHERFKHFECDISNQKDIDAFAAEIRKQTDHVDVLINNAGIASMNHFVLTPYKTAEEIMRVNYLGAFECIQRFVPLLRKSKHPRIVNFSSVAVPNLLEGEMAYAASKSAVATMTKILAKELSSFGITVNAIGPSPIKTNLIKNVPEKKINELLQKQAVKRYAEVCDVENVIDFFISEKSDFITGQVIYLGGISE